MEPRDLLARSILWVRRCPRCHRIDHRSWFETRGEALRRRWTCPTCGSRDFTLQRTRW